MKLEKESIFPEEDVCFHINDKTHYFPQLHSHNFYEIFFVLSGSIIHYIHNESRELTAGSTRLIYPEDHHQIEVKGNGRFCNIAFSVETMEKLTSLIETDLHCLSPECVLSPDELAHCVAECKKIAVLINQKNRNIQVKSMLLHCLAYLAADPVPVQEACPDWFFILLSRLSAPDVFTMQTREVCALSGYTPEYVSRCFRKYMGMTLTDYLLNLRLHYAGGLLTSTNLPILEVCFECGFRNLNYFYRCFHNAYGTSPKKYRDQNSVLL